MDDHSNNWNNKTVFLKQLELNKKELAGNYPPHWYAFIRILNSLNEKIQLLDIGCGVGSYYELCRRHCSNVKYCGVDYSNFAVEIAKNEWEINSFYTKNVNDLDIEYVSKYNMIHMGALLDVLPNGDEVLNNILKLNVKYVLLSRVDVAEKSEVSTYVAYDEITTYKYKHGQTKLFDLISDNHYEISAIDGNNLLLKNKKQYGN